MDSHFIIYRKAHLCNIFTPLINSTHIDKVHLLKLKNIAILSILTAVFVGCAASPDKHTKAVELFNGKDLDNFYTYTRLNGTASPADADVFSVEDGAIRISGIRRGCITSKDEFENYKITLEYKWGEDTHPPRKDKARDTGLLIHSVGPDGGFHKTWMYSLEVNIKEGCTGDFWVVGDKSDKYSLTVLASDYQRDGKTFSKFDLKNGKPKTIHNASIEWQDKDVNFKDIKGFRGIKDAENPAGEWNKLEVYARGDTIEVFVNGKFVNKAYNVRPAKGKIQLQSEDAEVFFRRVAIEPL